MEGWKYRVQFPIHLKIVQINYIPSDVSFQCAEMSTENFISLKVTYIRELPLKSLERESNTLFSKYISARRKTKLKTKKPCYYSLIFIPQFVLRFSSFFKSQSIMPYYTCSKKVEVSWKKFCNVFLAIIMLGFCSLSC